MNSRKPWRAAWRELKDIAGILLGLLPLLALHGLVARWAGS